MPLGTPITPQIGGAFQQDVPIGEQTRQQPVDQVFLAHDDAGDFILQRFDPLAGLFDLLGDFLGGAHE